MAAKKGTKKADTKANEQDKPKRRKRRKPQSLLSELTSPARAKRSFSYMLSGGLGFWAGNTIAKLVADKKPTEKAVIIGAGAFALSNFVGLNGVAAGMVGAAVHELMQPEPVSEGNAQYVNPQLLSEISALNDIEALPPVLDGEGKPLSDLGIYGSVPFKELPDKNIY